MSRSKRIQPGRHLKATSAKVPGPGQEPCRQKPGGVCYFMERAGLRNCGLSIAECGLEKGPKIRNPQFEIRNVKGRSFLPTRSLLPGPNPSIPEISNVVSPPAKPGVTYLWLNNLPIFILSLLPNQILYRLKAFRFCRPPASLDWGRPLFCPPASPGLFSRSPIPPPAARGCIYNRVCG